MGSLLASRAATSSATYNSGISIDSQGYYFTGDGARRDEDGYYWITGRVDDVVNVSGHRMGTAEVEAALDEHPLVSESAVVGVEHPVSLRAPLLLVSGPLLPSPCMFW